MFWALDQLKGIGIKIIYRSMWLVSNSMYELLYNYLGLNSRFSKFMMTSSNGNIFRVTGNLYGEFTGHRRIPRTKASDAELCSFVWFVAE